MRTQAVGDALVVRMDVAALGSTAVGSEETGALCDGEFTVLAAPTYA